MIKHNLKLHKLFKSPSIEKNLFQRLPEHLSKMEIKKDSNEFKMILTAIPEEDEEVEVVVEVIDLKVNNAEVAVEEIVHKVKDVNAQKVRDVNAQKAAEEVVAEVDHELQFQKAKKVQSWKELSAVVKETDTRVDLGRRKETLINLIAKTVLDVAEEETRKEATAKETGAIKFQRSRIATQLQLRVKLPKKQSLKEENANLERKRKK